MTDERQPTDESELRRQLRGRRVLVCVPVGDATELVETTIGEAVWLWLLAQERDSPSRVHLDDDDLETLDFAVLDFRGQPAASAECDAVQPAPEVAGVGTRRASMRP